MLDDERMFSPPPVAARITGVSLSALGSRSQQMLEQPGVRPFVDRVAATRMLAVSMARSAVSGLAQFTGCRAGPIAGASSASWWMLVSIGVVAGGVYVCSARVRVLMGSQIARDSSLVAMYCHLVLFKKKRTLELSGASLTPIRGLGGNVPMQRVALRILRRRRRRKRPSELWRKA